MAVTINPEMVTLAREYRGMTQEQLGRAMGVTQATIAKLEGGLKTDLSESHADFLSTALNFPLAFFQQNEELVGWGSSAYYYRKKASISAADRKRIQGQVNLVRIHLKTFLKSVEVEATRPLPAFDLAEQFSGSPIQAARAIRIHWNLPDGPIKNITRLIESAGVLIVPINFGTASMDATSLRLADLPPVIFINNAISGDRWRWTLAHELGHLVMHHEPADTMEDEADAFASEFLLPEIELKPQFMRIGKIRLVDLGNLKPYWKVSMQALLMRANSLEQISKAQAGYLWAQIGKLNYRVNEPNPLPREEVKTFAEIFKFFREELEFTDEDMAAVLKVNPSELESLYGVSRPGRPPAPLSLVRQFV